MPTERITILVDERGAVTVRRRLEDIGRTSRRAHGGVSLLQSALLGIGGGLAIRQLVQLSDAYTNLQNRLRVVTTNALELREVSNSLFDVSNQTRVSFEATARIFQRTAAASQELGVSYGDLIDFTRSLNQAVIISGATAGEAYGALIQLSQGIAATELRGQELRSVLEQLPFVAQVIADHLGVARGSLIQLGEQGKISAQAILDAFRETRDEINERFLKLIPTISQSFEVLRNHVIRYVGEVNEATGASRVLSQAIFGLANNLETAVNALQALAFVLAVTLARRAIPAVITALSTLGAAVRLNPLTALPALITGAVAVLIGFRNEIAVTGDRMVTVGDAISGAYRQLNTYLGILAGSGDQIDQTVDPAQRYAEELVKLQRQLEANRVSTQEFTTAQANLREEFLGSFEGVRSQVTFWDDFLDQFRRVAEGVVQQIDSIIQGFLLLDQVAGNVFISLNRTFTSALSNQGEAFGQFIDEFFERRGTITPESISRLISRSFRGLGSGIPDIANDFNAELQRDIDRIRNTSTLTEQTRAAAEARRTPQPEELLPLPGLPEPPRERVNRREQRLTEFLGDLVNENVLQAGLDDFERSVAETIRRAQDILGEERLVSQAERAAIRGALETGRRDQTRTELEEYTQAIERETQLLQLNSREREVQEALFEAEDQLKRDLTDSERALVRARVEARQALTDQNVFNDYLSGLDRERSLIGLSNEDRAVQEALLRAENLLKRELTDSERDLVTARVRSRLALVEEQAVLREVGDAARDYNRQLTLLESLLSQGSITSQQFVTAQRNLRLEFLQTQTDLSSGVERFYLQLQIDALDTASQIESVLTGAFNAVSNAFADFATGAGISFRNLVNSILAGIVRLATQRAFLQLLGPLLGPLFGGTLAGAGQAVSSGTAQVNAAGQLNFRSGFQAGGLVIGPGTGISDSIPTRLSNGEFVVNAQATQNNMALLNRINRGQSAGGNMIVINRNGNVNVTVEGGLADGQLSEEQLAQIGQGLDDYVDTRIAEGFIREQQPGGSIFNRGAA